MRSTRLSFLLALFLIGFAVVWSGELAWKAWGWAPVTVPRVSALGLLLWTALLALLGWQVRKISRREETWLGHAAAWPVLVAAMASARGGALFAGGFLARAGSYWLRGDTAWLHTEIFTAVFCALACLLLVGVALLVEHWGTLPPLDDSQKQKPEAQFGANSPQRPPAAARGANE